MRADESLLARTRAISRQRIRWVVSDRLLVDHSDEKLLVGYRWYDFHKVEPAFPFGHGLSYTTFHYSDLVITPRVCGPSGCADPTVTLEVTNNGTLGTRPGAEVVQVYLEFPASAGEPPQQLKHFAKTAVLGRGPVFGQKITLTLPKRSFSVWSVETHAWAEVNGTFVVKVGSSSRDIRLQGTLQMSM